MARKDWVRDDSEFKAQVADIRARCTIARRAALDANHANALLNIEHARRYASSAVQLDKTRGAYHSEAALRDAERQITVAERALELR